MKPSSEWHRVSEVDPAARTAVCSICGPVKARCKRGVWRCFTAVSQQKHPERPSREAFPALLAAQDGKCAICERPAEDGIQMCLDHCHALGVTRGVLCQKCNTALGLLDDDIERLYRAIWYLSRDHAKPIAI